MPSTNWAEVFENADADDAPPPAGDYQAVVETAEWTTAKSSGRDMLKYRLRISAGPEHGKALFGQVVVGADMKPFAQKKAVQQLEALGLSRTDLINNVDPQLHCEGAVVEVTTSIDVEYDPNNPRSRVDKLVRSNASAPRASSAPPPRDTPPSTPPPAPFAG